MALTIYTDGSYVKKTGHCGIGIVYPDHVVLSRGEMFPHDNPTNQRAELWAAFRGLQVALEHGLVKPGGKVTLWTDSKYTIGCFKDWLPAWERNDWINSQNKPVLNQDIIRPTVAFIREHRLEVHWRHVFGHKGHEHNEKADRLARAGR